MLHCQCGRSGKTSRVNGLTTSTRLHNGANGVPVSRKNKKIFDFFPIEIQSQ